MEWVVVSTIVVLVGLFFTIGRPILEFSNKVQKVIDSLAEHQRSIGANADKINEHDKTLHQHEIRIHDLEQEIN
jgi:hypothetical protein